MGETELSQLDKNILTEKEGALEISLDEADSKEKKEKIQKEIDLLKNAFNDPSIAKTFADAEKEISEKTLGEKKELLKDRIDEEELQTLSEEMIHEMALLVLKERALDTYLSNTAKEALEKANQNDKDLLHPNINLPVPDAKAQQLLTPEIRQQYDAGLTAIYQGKELPKNTPPDIKDLIETGWLFDQSLQKAGLKNPVEFRRHYQILDINSNHQQSKAKTKEVLEAMEKLALEKWGNRDPKQLREWIEKIQTETEQKYKRLAAEQNALLSSADSALILRDMAIRNIESFEKTFDAVQKGDKKAFERFAQQHTDLLEEYRIRHQERFSSVDALVQQNEETQKLLSSDFKGLTLAQAKAKEALNVTPEQEQAWKEIATDASLSSGKYRISSASNGVFVDVRSEDNPENQTRFTLINAPDGTLKLRLNEEFEKTTEGKSNRFRTEWPERNINPETGLTGLSETIALDEKVLSLQQIISKKDMPNILEHPLSKPLLDCFSKVDQHHETVKNLTSYAKLRGVSFEKATEEIVKVLLDPLHADAVTKGGQISMNGSLLEVPEALFDIAGSTAILDQEKLRTVLERLANALTPDEAKFDKTTISIPTPQPTVPVS